MNENCRPAKKQAGYTKKKSPLLDNKLQNKSAILYL
jgi:hypothetical protein